jgi:LysR family glycine cleavage system transcriptional activator
VVRNDGPAIPEDTRAWVQPWQHVIEAAIRAEGVALGRSVLVAEDLISGRLVPLFPKAKLEVEWGYDLVYRIGNGDHPRIRAFRSWIADEVREFSTGRFPDRRR